jgi:HPt (histidine-containing phosphotransfer) domain-containing protein
MRRSATENRRGGGGRSRALSTRGETSPLDLDYLRRFTQGNAALEREVLQLFLQQLPIYLTHLRASGTAKAWRQWSHTLKGSAAAVGAKPLAAAALAAEKLDFAEGEGARAAALAALAEAVEEVCLYIAAFGDGPGPSDPLVFAGNAG